MGDEIELISDGDGLAVIGDPQAVERFLSSAGVQSRDLELHQKLGSALSAGSGVAQAGSQIAANSGRWVKLTEESAKALKLGKAMKGSSDGVSRAIATTSKGKVTKILEFAKSGSVGSMLTSPAMLAGAAGIMAQLAMQQTMDEITEYLAIIDEKVDDILRAQKDAAIAEMIGVGMVIDDAMLKREHVGRVSEVTWSSLHGAAQTIATTQAYALRQLDALAEKMEKKSRVGDLAKLTGIAEATVEEWLAVLARCFQLQDGLAVLELDRVLDSSPDDLNRHRAALRAARAKRRDLISKSTERLLARMDAATLSANGQALFHPLKSGTVVRSGNEVAADVIVFHERLGIEAEREVIEAKRWTEAVGEAKDTAIETGGRGVHAVAQFGVRTFESAKSGTEKLSTAVAERLPRRREDHSDADDGAEHE
ncbi:hypothetical protein [Agromyces bauzanensis]|uniref:Uncharacterized protein n=1 Tax=Agromyces bauzanensis TaxID=1308924 RepID=A0A917PUD7_9MICO|nr:hypothetical protein [Agromyces bauzanensis]GGJ92702.1 hypothetical protein GCM10011372_34040 [Agromyces bauzanensis]